MPDDRSQIGGLLFALLDTLGDLNGSEIRVTNAGSFSERAHLVWTGSTYGLVWHDFRDSNWEVYFARLDPAGTKLGSDLRLTNAPGISSWPWLVWGGTEYGVFWHDERDVSWEIYNTVVDIRGSQIEPQTRLTYDGAGSFQPRAVWAGERVVKSIHVFEDPESGNGSYVNPDHPTQMTKLPKLNPRTPQATGISSAPPPRAHTGDGRPGCALGPSRGRAASVVVQVTEGW